VEAPDAVLGLYSNNVGSGGSAITFGEIAFGSLVDKWGIVRETDTGGKGLRITYGTSTDQFVNPTVMYLDDSGNVGIGTNSPDEELEVVGDILASGDYTYSSAKTHYLNLPACEFQRARSYDDIDYHLDSLGYGCITIGGEFTELCSPIHLPDGATVTEFRVYYYDDHSVADMGIGASLRARTLYQTTVPTAMASVTDTTSGSVAAVVSSYDNTIDIPVINNSSYQYYIWIILTQTFPSCPDMRFYGCKIKYTVDTVNP
jgi:hypothetical protein